MNWQPPKITRLVAASLVTAAIGTSSAQESSGHTRDTQGQMFVKLWMETCAKHFPNPEALRAAARAARLQESPPYANEILSGQAGTVWDASLGSLSQFSVVLFADGSCQVLGRRAASQPVSEAFESVIRGIRTPGISVEKVVDSEINREGAKLRQVAYFLSRTGADNGWSFVATVSDSELAAIQATITIARTAKPVGAR